MTKMRNRWLDLQSPIWPPDQTEPPPTLSKPSANGLTSIFFSAIREIDKGWGQNAKLGPHSAIWGKLGTALQAYALNPCAKFPPNPTSRKVNT